MDECEERTSQEDFLSHHDRDDHQNGHHEKNNSHEVERHEKPSNENIFQVSKMEGPNEDKDPENYDFNSHGPPSSEAKLLVPELNHLNALANLDPSSKFPESVSLQDMRFPPNATGEEESSKVFLCHLCDFKTAYANSLMNHQAVHSDVRPWACAMCEYAAKRKQDLKKHLHTVHGMMVESPMLKPILSSPGSMPKFTGMNDGLKEKELFAEGLNLKRSASSEQDFTFFPPASSSGHQAFVPKRIKDELPSMDMMSPPGHERKAPNMAELEDSPDDNLPVCFPPSSSKTIESSHSRESPLFHQPLPHMPSSRENGEMGMQFGSPMSLWHMKRPDKLPEPVMNVIRDWGQFPKPRENTPFPSGLMRGKGFISDSVSMGPKPLSMNRVPDDAFGHSVSDEDSTRDETQNHSASVELLNKPSETDRSISSSSTISHARSSQTQPGFMCEHCDILFFQRAMYLMHVGLHSPGDPWCCAVCGHSFTEKYSFTSHFINQH